MSFLSPELLWLLFLVPILIGAYIIAQRRRKKYALRYASLSLIKGAVGKGPGRRRHIPAILFLIGVTVMIVAVARPAAAVTLPSQKGTVILAIDVSGSMRADDLKPSRLDAAKSAAKTFVEKQPANVSIGVVAFSDNASLVQSPVTDKELVTAAINRLAIQRGTGIGRAMLTSLAAIFEGPGGAPMPLLSDPLGASAAEPPLERVPAGSYASAVVVLLSDGVSNVGPRPLDVIEEAIDRGIRFFSVGVGSPEGSTLKLEGRSMRVRLDEDTLKSIAEKTGGDYFKADSETDLVRIYDNLSMKLILETKETELTSWFTGLATALLLAAGTISMLWFNRLP